MHSPDWFVILAGVAGIVWVNWYFFLAERSAVAAQAATIVVRGGYEPSTIRVKAGVPVRLTFDRRETSSCSEEIVFPDFGVRQFLPANEQTTVVVTPPAAGSYEFTCGMSMLHGRLIAE